MMQSHGDGARGDGAHGDDTHGDDTHGAGNRVLTKPVLGQGQGTFDSQGDAPAASSP